MVFECIIVTMIIHKGNYHITFFNLPVESYRYLDTCKGNISEIDCFLFHGLVSY